MSEEAAPGAPALEPYREVTDSQYADTAAASFSIEGQGDAVTLRGPCPRCHVEIEINVTNYVARGLFHWPGKSGLEPNVEPVVCTCTEPHEGRPEGLVGCGAYWNFTL